MPMRLQPHQIEPSDTNGQVLKTVSGEVAWASGAPSTALVRLVSTLNGEPGDIWTDDDEPIFVEVPL